MKAKLVATLLLLVFVLVFIIQNAAAVEVHLLFWQVTLPRSLLILTMLFIGIVIGWFLRAMLRISRTGS